MKRLLALAALAAATVLAIAVVSGGATTSQGSGGKVIRVVERATTDTITYNTTAGVDTVGDLLTFANDVYNASNTTKVGTDEGYCVRTAVGVSWECNWTTFLRRGQIVVEGPFLDAGSSRLAITGGTGAYRNARGWMELNFRPDPTEFDFVFHVIG